MTFRSSLIVNLALLAMLGLGQMPLLASAPPEPADPAKDQAAGSFVNDVVPFLAKHCYSCHGKGKKRGDVSLDVYRNEHEIQKDRDLWENVLQMVRTGEMPPKARPRPHPEEAEAALSAIDAVLAKFDCTSERNPGRVTVRRLNRSEYNNTIRDLVGVDFQPAADFPNDDVGYGFDNIGDVLSLSPLLLEKYLSAAESILDRAIVINDPHLPAKNRLGSLRVPAGEGEVTRRGARIYGRASVSAQSFFEEGDYVISFEAYGKAAGDEPVRAALRLKGDIVQEFEVRADESEPATFETKVHFKAETARVGVSFLNPFEEEKAEGSVKARRELFVRNVVVDGPYNAPAPVFPESHRRIMEHRPDLSPRDAAREIITRFAARAVRRPVKSEEVDRFLKLYDRAEAEGDRFEDRVRLALEGVLVWPHFLFRIELDPTGVAPGTSYPVGEYELASRLSYFLWSSMPDDELLVMAGKGQLRANLDTQVRRMLRDARSSAFVQNFAGQWLTIRKLGFVSPDAKEFPGFDEELRSAMYRETELFFEAILREDRSILDLLDADFSFVNERLAKHYGIEGVTGKEFRRVKLPPNRGGVLTQASILTLTSNPTRTSPVKRGKWVLDQILNTPPPPPPPDVPELTSEKQLTGSLRKVMEEHRQNVLCASCHQRMDPIGFAFENYDAIGAWREKDGAFPIDPSGVLPGGQSFQGPAELKVILKGKKELFSRCLAEKMLTYALGRGLEYYDKCAVDEVLKALDKNDSRFSALVVGVVTSEPFQLRTATGDEP